METHIEQLLTDIRDQLLTSIPELISLTPPDQLNGEDFLLELNTAISEVFHEVTAEVDPDYQDLFT